MAYELYRLEGCPYCDLVTGKLDSLDIQYESIWVEGLHSQRNEVARVSGQRQVPVLVDDEQGLVISESDHILDYLNENYT